MSGKLKEVAAAAKWRSFNAEFFKPQLSSSKQTRKSLPQKRNTALETVRPNTSSLSFVSSTSAGIATRSTTVKLSNMETTWQDHRKPTHPMTFSETNILLKGLIATRRNLLISLEYSRDAAEICARCARTSPFRLADPNVVLSLLGYCWPLECRTMDAVVGHSQCS